jgi:hypothetical protein
MGALPAGDKGFCSVIGAIAIKLLGEPGQKLKQNKEWRYGSHGSLAIDLTKGVWHDFEAGVGGGVTELVIRERGGDRESAIEWLEDNDFAVQSWEERIDKTYDYVDERGRFLFQVVRFKNPKEFRQRHRGPDGKWLRSTKGIRKVLYRLPELIRAVGEGKLVVIVEGEKDVDNLHRLNFCATCNPGGAGKWRDEYNEHFCGADIAIVPDNDPQAISEKDGSPRFHPDGRPVLPGHDHGNDVASRLHAVAKRIRWLELPGLPLKGDVSDWIAAGGTCGATIKVRTARQSG